MGGIERRIDDTVDVVLIGPQVAYQKSKVKAACDVYGIPMDVIPMQVYGMVNGKAAFELAQKLAAQK